MVSLLLYLEWCHCCFIWNGGREFVWRRKLSIVALSGMVEEICTTAKIAQVSVFMYAIKLVSLHGLQQINFLNDYQNLIQKILSLINKPAHLLAAHGFSIVYNFANGLMVFLQPFPLIPLWFNIIFFQKKKHLTSYKFWIKFYITLLNIL